MLTPKLVRLKDVFAARGELLFEESVEKSLKPPLLSPDLGPSIEFATAGTMSTEPDVERGAKRKVPGRPTALQMHCPLSSMLNYFILFTFLGKI